jgi:hypothetical protein
VAQRATKVGARFLLRVNVVIKRNLANAAVGELVIWRALRVRQSHAERNKQNKKENKGSDSMDST